VVIHGGSLLLPKANCEEQQILEKSMKLAAACTASLLSAFLEEVTVLSICCGTDELLIRLVVV
jgi:hypothetical protein